MKKLTGIVMSLAFVLCAFSAQNAVAQVTPPGGDCNASVECNNGDYCDGIEVCVQSAPEQQSTCVAGTPVDCDDGDYCNGGETCNEGTDRCDAGTPPCGGAEPPVCDEANDTCVECLVNGDCDDGVFCNGTETCSANSCVAGVAPCEDGVVCDEDNDICVECVSDDNCTSEEPYCVGSVCVECETNLDCPENGDPCDGEEICSAGQCQSAGNPCPGQICVPQAVPVSEPAAALPPDYICTDCVSDDNCTDGLFCNGYEECQAGTCVSSGDPCQLEEPSSLPADLAGPVCDEANDTCVECLTDDNCTEAEPFCNDNNECVECISDDNCTDDVFCNGPEACDNGTCMPFEGDVCERGELCNEEIDQCVGCLDDGDCEGDNNTPRCGESFQCVECVDALDCAEEEVCNEQGTCVTAECELNINPKKIRINKMFRPIERKFKITGDEGFDPYAELDFGILQPNVRTAKVDKKGRLRVLVTVPTRARLYKGLVEIRVGNCVGYVELK